MPAKTKRPKRKRPRRPSKTAALDYINPALHPLVVPIEPLIENPRNVRRHDNKNLEAIETSLRKFGQQKPIVLDPGDETIVTAGNGTLRVAKSLGWEYIAAIPFHLSGREAEAFGVADNRSSDLSTWHDAALVELLESFKKEDEGLLIGFTQAELDQLIRKVTSISDAELLKKIKVTIDDPKTAAMHGEIWSLGDHTLVVADPVNEVRRWKPLLEDDMLFCPYPGPFVPLTIRAQSRIMLLVQPDPFIVGHILDKYKQAYGARSVKRAKED